MRACLQGLNAEYVETLTASFDNCGTDQGAETLWFPYIAGVIPQAGSHADTDRFYDPICQAFGYSSFAHFNNPGDTTANRCEFSGDRVFNVPPSVCNAASHLTVASCMRSAYDGPMQTWESNYQYNFYNKMACNA